MHARVRETAHLITFGPVIVLQLESVGVNARVITDNRHRIHISVIGGIHKQGGYSNTM